MRRDGWNAGRLTLWLSLYGKEWGSDLRLPGGPRRSGCSHRT